VPPISNDPSRKPLSFHAVSFGEDAAEATLRRMAYLALNLQNNPPNDTSRPVQETVPSSFATALDTVSTRGVGVDMT